jgi:transposase
MRLYKERRRIENAFGRLKDFRRIATRSYRLACNFLACVCIVVALGLNRERRMLGRRPRR